MELIPGRLYTVAGCGPMRLIDPPDPSEGRCTCRFETTGLLNYWASPDDIVREADAEYLDRHAAALRAAGMERPAVQIEKWREAWTRTT